MKTKDRIAVLLCVKGFFFSTCVCRVCVLEKSVTREQNESTPPPQPPRPSTHHISLTPHASPPTPIISNPLYQNLLSFSVDA